MISNLNNPNLQKNGIMKRIMSNQKIYFTIHNENIGGNVKMVIVGMIAHTNG